MSEYQRQWYAKNADEQRAKARVRVNQRRAENRSWVLAYLKGKSCTDCGITDIRVLEFDHVRGEKWMAIADAVARGYNLDRIRAEVDKCELVCCNCHHLRTCARRGDSWHDIPF